MDCKGCEGHKGCLCGGISARAVDDTMIALGNEIKSEIETTLSKTFNKYTVVKASTQVVAGSMTRLTIEVDDGHQVSCAVWEKPWEHFRQVSNVQYE
ncbi:hypothetical protein WA158_008192 [Blastocystis sp. Blastoise]